MKFEPHKTAIARNKWTKPGRWLYENYFQKNNKSIDSMLDFGAGKSIDSDCWAEKTGAFTQAYDQFEQPQFPGRGIKPTRQFDLVTIIFVLNVISTENERVEVLNDAMQYVKSNGYLFVATRSRREIERARMRSEKKGNKWEQLPSGAYISCGRKKTVQFGIDDGDLEQLVSISNCHNFKHINLEKHPGSEIGCALFQNL